MCNNQAFYYEKKGKEGKHSMTTEELTIKITEHKEEIGSLKHRMDNVEEQHKTIQSLTLSVKELAINMQNMITAQQGINTRLTDLESKPSKRWEAVVTTLIGAVIGAVVARYL